MFKKKILKVIVVILFVSSLSFIVLKVYLNPNKTKNNESVIANPVADLTKVTPGTTTKEEVINQLGEPIKTTENTSSQTLFYNSTSKTRNSQVIIEKGTATLIKEIVTYKDPKKVSDITKVYGLSNYSLFGPDSAGGNKLYIYPDKGIAYIGKPQFDTLEEIWYFAPTTISDFKEKWAPGYSEKEVLNPY